MQARDERGYYAAPALCCRGGNATVCSMTRRSEEAKRKVIGRAGVLAIVAVLLTSCAHDPAQRIPADLQAIPECAPGLQTEINLAAAVLPIQIPRDVTAKGAHETRGLMARRVTVTFAPRAL